MTEDGVASGWTFVAETEGAAALLEAVLGVDPDERYTRSELATAAGVALKTVYLAEPVGALVELGVLEETTGDDGAPRYAVNTASPVYHAAQSFDEAVAETMAPDARD